MKKLMVVVGFALIGFLTVGCSGSKPGNLGLQNGSLAACPSKPNCVSSQQADEGHYIKPLQYRMDRDEARRRLLGILEKTDRVKVVEQREEYIRAEYRSFLFRFVDDVEFYFSAEKVIHVRSASRLGYSDLGVNRKRIEWIRAQFRENGDR